MIKNYWNDGSTRYNDVIDGELEKNYDIPWKNYILREVEKDQSDNLKILDIGTGPGFFPFILSGPSWKVTGIDLSEKMIEYAGKRLKEAKIESDLFVMDCLETSFDDESFDVILCRNLVWTLPNPIKAYEEWHRILKKGGKLLIFDGAWYIHHYDEEEKKRFYGLKAQVEKDYGIQVFDYGNKEEQPEDYKLMRALYLSGKKRPHWDEEILQRIGFSVEKIVPQYLDEILGKEQRLKKGDISPVFFIKASK